MTGANRMFYMAPVKLVYMSRTVVTRLWFRQVPFPINAFTCFGLMDHGLS